MDCNNVIKHLSLELKNGRSQENEGLDELRKMDEEIENIKTQLSECHIQYEQTEMLTYDVDQRKTKEELTLKNVKWKYSTLEEDFQKIHCNYVNCLKKATTNDKLVDQEVNYLTIKRDNLKNELEKLKAIADENSKKLTEVRKMIVIQEKKNMALTKKLKRLSKNVHMPSNLKDKVNALLNDQRIIQKTRITQPADH